MTAPTIDSAPTAQPKPNTPNACQGGLLDPKMLWKSMPDALRKLNPRTLWRNPVMFIVEIGAVVEHRPRDHRSVVVRLADRRLAVADGDLRQPRRGRRRRPRQGAGRVAAKGEDGHHGSPPHRLGPRRVPASEEEVAAPLLQQGDVVVVEAGQMIPGDGDVVEGIASVDESAITGESAPVIRESGGDRSAVTGGTTVLSDRIVVKITQKPGESFIDRMIALVEGANRQKTPNEIALNILLASLTIIFVFAVATLQPLAIYSKANNPGVADTLALNGSGISRHRHGRAAGVPDPDDHRRAAVGDRHRGHGPPGSAQRARHVGPCGGGRGRRQHAAARQDRHHHAGQPAGVGLRSADRRDTRGARRRRAARPASPTRHRRAARSSCTPSRSYGLRARTPGELDTAHWVEFSATTRMSGVDLGRAAAAQGRGRLGRRLGALRGRRQCRPNSATSSTASPPRAAHRWSSARSSR